MLVLVGMQGHATSAAATLAEAREQLETTPPTHVILDLNLPDGLGTELLRDIRTRGLPTRVILMTGSTETHLLAEVRELGVDFIATKPPDWGEVIRWAGSK